MADIVRMSPAEVRNRVESASALLVCAYDNEEKFRKNRLEGAIALSEFESKTASLSEHQEIIFYCA